MRLIYCVPILFVTTLPLQSAVGAPTDLSEEDELAMIYGDKSSVSIATGTAQPLRRAPAVATVITAEEIATMGATDLDQVLETVPGMHVARAALNYEPLYVTRGIYSATNAQILVLQNGVPMTTLLTGSRGPLWGGYPLEHIARIEIIRGPGSALYGADAYSGVINIITKGAAETQGTQFAVGSGSFKTRDAWLQHGGKLGSVDVAAYLRVGGTDGFREIITADAQTARDKIFGTNASLAPGPVNVGYDSIDGNLDLGLDKWRLRAGYKLRSDMGTGAGVASALDPVGKERSERITTDIGWTDAEFADDWSVGVTASALQYKQRITTDLRLSPPGTRFPTGLFPDGFIGHPDTSERQIRVSAFAMYSGFGGHKVRIGVGHDNLNMYHTATFKNYIFNAAGVPVPTGPVIDYSQIQPFLLPQRRKISYINAQDEWRFARDWTLTAGVRHDRYSDFGGTTNPRLAVVWDAALDLTAKLLYGRAFRAPSFNEEFGINNPVNRGNPNLQPETIGTLEAAFAWQASKDLQLNLNVFKYSMQDIIRAIANANSAGPGTTFSNTGNQDGKGLELEAVWEASRSVHVAASYAYQRSIDTVTNHDAGYAPRHHFNGRVDIRIPGIGVLSPQLNRVADRYRSAGDMRPKVPNYTTFDLSLSSGRNIANWDFSIAIRNMFNADVREPSVAPAVIPNDLPMAPRSIYVRAIYRL
ncbi:TonB-dependent receptor plug domain-containing protein [Pseudoduganella namucuonensis]|uniref:Iron complex outermembrane recepter protein n=1 Tax=Pseudoduganella namucuonensis TaxID=1035707 RepID=A0A1I7HEK4_9BURK|nr:TonB-dependent receptor [Pseudoduganella namucuonensis]SFU59145.1 iron complex outermembrane recepter protein [Pseudoduganella namucuonensis]